MSTTQNRKTGFTQTMLVSLKKNRILEAPNKKKTTFLELFFDLAIVFVFTTLSSRFADYLGISPKIFMGENEASSVTHAEIGLFYWIVNFIALWQVWYRYGVLFRTYGNEGIMSHLLTFSLILVIGVQALTLTIDTEFFAKYGLLLAFGLSKLILYAFEASMLIKANKKSKSTHNNLRKVLFETIGVVVFLIMLATYVALTSTGVVDLVKDGSAHDGWKVQLMISSIIAITVIVDLVITIAFHTKTVQLNEVTIYAHTKERHHLLVIIALGESVLFNIGKGVINEADLIKIIPELVLNLLIIMAMWYLYKIYVFRVSYASGQRNVSIFAIVHIFIVAGMMLMFSSLEAYAEAQTEQAHLAHLQHETHATFVALRDLDHAMNLTYPAIYMSGFLVFAVSIIATLWSMKRGHEPYDRVVNKKIWATSVSQLVILFAIVIIWGVLMSGIHFHLLWIFMIMIGLLFVEFIFGVYLTNKFMIEVTGSEKKAIEELEKLEK